MKPTSNAGPTRSDPISAAAHIGTYGRPGQGDLALVVRNDRTIATVVNKAMVRGPDGTIPPKQLLGLLGIDRDILPVPEHIRRWVDAESVVKT
jgi:hypothetical protein